MTHQFRRSGRSNSPSKFRRFGGNHHGAGGRIKYGNRHRGGKLDISKFINKDPQQVQINEIPVVNEFKDFQLDNRIKANVAKKGYIKPTPIQDQAIPHILKGRDLVGIANTGTGKTAAFLLPFLNKIMANRTEKVLILTPTRELAMQIKDEFLGFAQGLGLYAVLCIGGANIGFQIRDIHRGFNIVIGTPGRIKDLHKRRILKLANFKNVVVDEADRMLDMGFIHDIKFLLEQLPKERHSLFFSATISGEVEGLIKTFLRDPITISVKKRETSANIHQDVIRIKTGIKRIDMLKELLKKEEFKKVLVFGRTKHGVEKISVDLAENGFKVASLHGDKSQYQRQNALRQFKDNRVNVLVATDVAARGLDIDNVSHVINYDLPENYDDYIHRIGRTGRADKIGCALTFID